MSRTLSGLFTISAAIGGIIAGILVAVIVRRVGRGILLRGGSIALALGTALFISGGPLAVTILGPFISSAAGAGCIVGVSAFLSAQQGPASDAALTEGNTLSAFFGIVGPLSLGAAATWLGGWRVSFVLLIICLIALEIARGRGLQAYRIADVAPRTEKGQAQPLPPLAWWAILTLVCTCAVEMCFIFWATDLLAIRGGWDTAAAAAGLAALVLGILIGRAVGSWLVERLDAERALAGALVLLALGFLVTWAFPYAWVMLIGLFVVGLGISLQFPLGMSRTMRASAGQADKAAGYASAGIGTAGATVPFALAVLADSFGIHTAFLAVPVLITVAMVLLRRKPVPPLSD